MQASTAFRMNKWYLDGISEAGETFIGYSAEVSWKSLGLSYASRLEFDGQRAPATATDFFRSRQPQAAGRSLTWTSKRLSCSGTWHTALADALPPLTLYDSSQGKIIWHCLQPLSEMHVQTSDRKFNGLGYVERLEMTMLPWHLPIRELRWGRFLASDVYLVWIEWRGPHPLTLAYVNGTALDDVQIAESGITWNSGGLELNDQIVLREGPLIHTALAGFPGIQALFPKCILDTDERKWRSRGILSHKGKTHTGWAVHEIVRFQ